MPEDSLDRIETKVDSLVANVGDLKSTVLELAVGQANLEHRVSSTSLYWTELNHVLQDVRGMSGLRQQVETGFANIIRSLDGRFRPLEDATRGLSLRLEDHERRIQALENRS